MAAEVNSSEILITRDLLGQFSKVKSNKDLDLKDLKHLQTSLDLKTEMTYQQRCNSPNSPLSSSSSLANKSQTYKEIFFLNIDRSPSLKSFEESCLELKLLSTSNDQFQSVCTLDKVKFALKKAEKDQTLSKKRSVYPLKEQSENKVDDEITSSSSSDGMFAAACSGCLMYVMTLKTNPKCPRCNSVVPYLSPFKKPRIDLNITSL